MWRTTPIRKDGLGTDRLSGHGPSAWLSHSHRATSEDKETLALSQTSKDRHMDSSLPEPCHIVADTPCPPLGPHRFRFPGGPPKVNSLCLVQDHWPSRRVLPGARPREYPYSARFASSINSVVLLSTSVNDSWNILLFKGAD